MRIRRQKDSFFIGPIQAAVGFGRAQDAAVAIEFALVAPVLLALIFGIFQASYIMATMNGLEQLTAGAARSAVSGLSSTERDTLARAYITASAPAYPYIDPTKLQVATASTSSTSSFSVTATYDISSNAIYIAAKGFLPVPSPTLSRTATIQQGGY